MRDPTVYNVITPEEKDFNTATGVLYVGGIVYFFDGWDHERAFKTDDFSSDLLGRILFTDEDTGKRFILSPQK